MAAAISLELTKVLKCLFVLTLGFMTDNFVPTRARCFKSYALLISSKRGRA